MKLQSLTYCFLFLVFVQVFGQNVKKLQLDQSNSYLTYDAEHFTHNWTGTNEKPKGLLVLDENGTPKQIAVTAALTDFNSQNANRDAHALEILNALIHANVRFYSSSIVVDESEITFLGYIELAGKKVEKTISLRFETNADQVQIKGTFEVKLSDFDIPRPSFLLKKVKDEIQLKVLLNFK